MKWLKNSFLITFLAGAIVFLAGCQHKENNNTIKVGTMAGPETQLMQEAQTVAQQKYGLHIQIVQFTDYTMPNEALADGSIDANMFQTIPYLEEAVKAKNYKIVAVGKTFVYPMGVYSSKIKKLSALPKGATVGIPNDPSNEARALLLLQQGGLIKLKPDAGTNATPADVISNPKDIKFKELDAAQLPRALPDVDLAAINTNYAMLANLLPSRDALLIEKPDSPYANLVVVREDQKNDPKFKELVDALHSQAVVDLANKLFKGQAIAAWSKS